MPRCTRKGCGKEFAEGDTEPCIFHPGGPKFHEGLKSWTCCSEVNKPVLDFDEFMKILGCAETDRHTTDVPQVEPVGSSASETKAPAENEENPTNAVPAAHQAVPTPIAHDPAPAEALPPPQPIVEEEDDLDIPVQPGTACRRRGCKTTFVSDDENRKGDGEGTQCTYHPAPPIFREGSKTAQEELTTCRIDHYQTVDKVYVSIFAKKAEKDASKIEFEVNQVSVDLRLPGNKRFVKTIELFGPVDPTASSYHFFGTKVELTLKKQDNRSWTILEKPVRDLGNISLTFGVTGRTGTIGAKESILDEQNKPRA
ncbi:hypothetical protein VNI00_005847 [Paramarasmius palmivorus]|uniref:Chord-domain-containing protein n=1 Tax=Paramarasmius palmivorus TaxID=297713 RepID=A0AAW0DGT7_9AGAR